MIKSAIALCFLLQTAFCLAQTPDLGDARVSLSYKELKSLIEAAHPEKAPAKPKPPLASALLSARYQMTLLNDHAEGMVEIEVQSFSDDWAAIPLLESGAQIDRAEPADARVIVRDGHYALVSEHAGTTKITLHFARPFSTGKEGQVLVIPFAPAAIRTLALTGVPEGKTIQVEGATFISGGKGAASYRLPDDQEAVAVNIIPQPEPPTPSHWKIESAALVNYAEGKLNYRSHVSAFADGGSGLEMDLELPPAARLLEVNGDDLLNWNAGKTVHVTWKTRNILAREIELRYEIAQPASTGDWKLVAPRLADGETAGALFAVEGEPGMEIHATNEMPGHLPHWLAQEVSHRNAAIAGSDGAISVKWLPLVPTSPAVIDFAQSAMRVVPDGALINDMTYAIRHEGPLTWQLHLPDGSQLLACSVNGQRINPVDRGGGVIELVIDAVEGKPVSEVKISCTARKEAFKPVSGQIELELPRTDLLIQKLDWELQIPAGYELAAIEGNAEARTSGRAGLILLHKELCKNEQPGIRVYYQKPETKK